MKEAFEHFENRIEYQKDEQFAESGRFTPDRGLSEKVSPDNSLCPFYGDTVVFELDENVKSRVAEMIDRLYNAAPECFCEKLRADTIHMTMHDLSAGVSEQVTAENEAKLRAAVVADPIPRQMIRMKTHTVLNMVGRSLVLALLPVDEKEWDKLQEIYAMINNVKVCDYPFFTPHITLGYYSCKGFDDDARIRLKAVIDELNREGFEITLNTEKLFYQHFTDMNHYENIFSLTD